MATYAIGDIQGCYLTFRKLLEKIEFDPVEDRLWLAGDLVNRGPRSLETLRWAYRNRDSIQVVLGNHDLKLLAVAAGASSPSPQDTLDELLAAPDRTELLDWLRRRPLLVEEGPLVLVHAGLLPSWPLAEARGYAREAEAALQDPGYARLLQEAIARRVDWRNDLTGAVRWRGLTDIFTRMRMCTRDGRPSYRHNGPPEEAPGEVPWFALPAADRGSYTIVFGHWAALGLYIRPGIIGIDTGCVWGGTLTAVRLPDLTVFQEPYVD
ncbi:MAG: symmetrical bis(5'-nucleosyl)-tetraphosphatase [Bryobacterales bacterium]|nr:symmetrical bis(5'-nucleosyl)-tetraphosphatase [Bryobacterales bacterium]MDE0295741.1 symmetrical bis(5'-nucleosyl)-tetraphosphatase [Bryobacterales bacterium]